MESLTLERAEAMLEQRNRCFMDADMASYLAMWTEDCVVEVLLPPGAGAASVRMDRAALEGAVGAAWRTERVLRMETRSFGVAREALLNEFSIVWEHRETGQRRLQTGMGSIAVAEGGLWRSLRDHYDPGGASMQTALESPSIASLLSNG